MAANYHHRRSSAVAFLRRDRAAGNFCPSLCLIRRGESFSSSRAFQEAPGFSLPLGRPQLALWSPYCLQTEKLGAGAPALGSAETAVSPEPLGSACGALARKNSSRRRKISRGSRHSPIASVEQSD